jgi:hypothetical protein
LGSGQLVESVQSHTSFIAFRAASAFRFGIPNASKRADQTGKPGRIYLTNVQQFAVQALQSNPKVQLATETVRLPCLPIEAWASTDFSGKSLLVLLPTQALGDCTQATMALQALLEQRTPRTISVACAGAAYDIIASNPRLDVRSLWFEHGEASRFDYVIDLGHMSATWDIDIWPVDFETAMLEAFDLSASESYSAEPRRLPTSRRPKVGVLPLASSPLRTLPVRTVEAIVLALADKGDITLCLNSNQNQGRLMAAALSPERGLKLRILDNFATIAGLVSAIREFDYAIFADSGPAHIAKLFGTPGVAVYTSAPSRVLQGRFRNLSAYDVPFSGPHCSAPCGLAKVRQARDGRIGCMGSLGLALDDLPSVPRTANPVAVQHLAENPAPCVAALDAGSQRLAKFIQANFEHLSRQADQRSA